MRAVLYLLSLFNLFFFLGPSAVSMDHNAPKLSIRHAHCFKTPARAGDNDSFPFIQHLALSQWSELMNELVKGNLLDDSEPEVLLSSCVNTVYALAIVFIGEAETKYFTQRISRIHQGAIRIEIEPHTITEYLVELFEGYVLCRIQEFGYKEFYDLPKDLQKDYISSFVRKQRIAFSKYIEPHISEILDSDESPEVMKRNIDKYFLDTDYKFNQIVISKLRDNISDNNKLINHERSFVYFIFIYNQFGNAEHAWAIEQFIQGQGVRFRRYQSWIHQATFVEDLQRNRNSWGAQELEYFLDALEVAYCGKNSEEAVNLMACFGYDDFRGQLVSYQNQKFSGLTLCYLAFAFDPKDCAKNVEQFLTKTK